MPFSQNSSCRFIVLTGGPGAGKTAVMEAARQIFSNRIAILPEAASVVYSGGFPRLNTPAGIRASQRAIFRVQEELENYAKDEGHISVALCDRGIVDGGAYWPAGPDDFFAHIGFNRFELFSRYSTVIHLKTPRLEQGYNLSNPVRIESPEEAAALDLRIEEAWAGHPHRIIVPATDSFTDKLDHVTSLIQELLLYTDKGEVWAEGPSLMM